MDRRPSLAVALAAVALAYACGARPARLQPAPSSRLGTQRPSPSPSPPVAPVAPGAPAALAPRCRIAGPAARAPTEAPPDTEPAAPPRRPRRGTCADLRRAEARLAAELARRYRRSTRPSRVEVRFDCDPLSDELTRIRFASGSAISRSLSFYVLARGTPQDPDAWTVRGIVLREDDRTRPEQVTYEAFGHFQTSVVAGVVPAATMRDALPRLRAALTARAREIEPRRRRGSHPVVIASVGATQFHVFAELVDDAGEVQSHDFTGAASGRGQDRALGAAAAEQVITSLVGPLESTPLDWSPVTRAPTEDERATFVELLGSHPHALEPRWVGERVMVLANAFAEPAQLPAVLRLLEVPPDPPDERDPPVGPLQLRWFGGDRARVAALAVLARLTGWDARRDDAGRPRPLAAVVADYLRECAAAAAADR